MRCVRHYIIYFDVAFCLVYREALDQKTPMLRSMQALSKAAKRVLALLGEGDVAAVNATVGTEQEYFLIDREYYSRRLDLLVCGRTLLGAKPPKGQELEDHYYGRIRTRVDGLYEDLDKNLWELGVAAKPAITRFAPAQQELAVIFATVNVATDNNQACDAGDAHVARRPTGLPACCTKKPFAGVNGAASTTTGRLPQIRATTCFPPQKTPERTSDFCCFIPRDTRAQRYYDLVRLSVHIASNDCRLGGSEAPPAHYFDVLASSSQRLLSEIAEAKTNDATVREKAADGRENAPAA